MTDLFADVIGHEGVVDLLRSELERPAQAYLFVGPQSVGKEFVALRFATGLLGGATDERTRRLALMRAHPDLTVLEPEGATSLGVDQAREVVARASLAPVEAPRTVFFFPDAGSMTEQAANALLKTLEEPSSQTVFLLVAESEDDFPPTVASRCRSVHMGRVPLPELARALVERGLSEEAAEGVAVVSGGRPGLALALMSQPEVARFRQMWLSIPSQVTPHPGDGQRLAMEVLAELAPLVDQSVPEDMPKDKAQRARRRAEMSLLVSGLEILASWYSDSASLQLGGPIRNSDLDLAAFTDVAPRRAVSSAEKILDAVVDIQANLRRELVLANLFSALGSER
jgi:DNA polymerase III subunit delta'